MINVELIGKKKHISYIILLVIWNIGILSGISSLFFDDKILFNLLFIFLASFFIWIIGNLLIKSYIIIGNIEIGANSIKISENNKILDIDISMTKKFILNFNGAKGDSYGYVGFFRINDGSKNTISFEYAGLTYKLKFLVSDKHFLNSIYKFVKVWKENGVEIKIFRYKKDITLKLLTNVSHVS
jgi:hypothetical protein